VVITLRFHSVNRSPYQYACSRAGSASVPSGTYRQLSRAYTIGLTAAGLPELVLTGMSANRAQALLNDIAAHVRHGGALAPGGQHGPEGGPLIEVVELTEPTAHLFVAVELYGKGIRAQQLVHADDRGHWPWDVGYRGVRGGQPVLGVRAAPAASAA
jgi:hypothetical protein